MFLIPILGKSVDNKNMGKISGKNIVKRMLERKDLKYFSQDLGIPNQTISNWKTRDAPPKAEELLAIAQYLNVSIEWLLTVQERAAPKIPPEILDTAYEIFEL